MARASGRKVRGFWSPFLLALAEPSCIGAHHVVMLSQRKVPLTLGYVDASRMGRDRNQQMMLDSVGRRMAEIRRDRGLTQEQVATAAAIDVQAVQRAETGRTALSFGRLYTVAKALGVTVADLFSETGPTPPPPEHFEDSQVLNIYLSIPEDRRKWAVRILEQLARD